MSSSLLNRLCWKRCWGVSPLVMSSVEDKDHDNNDNQKSISDFGIVAQLRRQILFLHPLPAKLLPFGGSGTLLFAADSLFLKAPSLRADHIIGDVGGS